jgi:CDP-glucose 4,6-dehydratase
MSAMLSTLGHEVHGLSHEVLQNSHFNLAEVHRYLASDSKSDIRDYESLKRGISSVQPDVVVHLAAQALVRESYRKPYETFDTNVRGTINVVKACQESQIPKILIVTSDKVYKESKNIKSFSEEDALGGKDPYSASKAAADIASQSLAQLSGVTHVSIARAGNVIGGGDFGQERLIPDLYRAQISQTAAQIRYPNAIRPWQHVLDCLDGYITIINGNPSTTWSDIWNVGPIEDDKVSVRSICEKTSDYFGNPTIFTEVVNTDHTLVENQYLQLNSTKIQHELGWKPRLNTSLAIEWTLYWYQSLLRGESPSKITFNQIKNYYDL